ncbi:HHR188Cp [Eremothecium sinecaudum]|uniref:HHR188Cp n=1 Tax=Eremothecium sinecaudum TaxID=45286 RepID=A0A0X8HWS3_9SACH|nr:HHR188Cp [Eremothecium sinecaudum]AMD22957.1 HHR188Cp [Eremothecium sinecaudum]
MGRRKSYLSIKGFKEASPNGTRSPYNGNLPVKQPKVLHRLLSIDENDRLELLRKLKKRSNDQLFSKVSLLREKAPSKIRASSKMVDCLSDGSRFSDIKDQHSSLLATSTVSGCHNSGLKSVLQKSAINGQVEISAGSHGKVTSLETGKLRLGRSADGAMEHSRLRKFTSSFRQRENIKGKLTDDSHCDVSTGRYMPYSRSKEQDRDIVPCLQITEAPKVQEGLYQGILNSAIPRDSTFMNSTGLTSDTETLDKSNDRSSYNALNNIQSHAALPDLRTDKGGSAFRSISKQQPVGSIHRIYSSYRSIQASTKYDSKHSRSLENGAEREADSYVNSSPSYGSIDSIPASTPKAEVEDKVHRFCYKSKRSNEGIAALRIACSGEPNDVQDRLSNGCFEQFSSQVHDPCKETNAFTSDSFSYPYDIKSASFGVAKGHVMATNIRDGNLKPIIPHPMRPGTVYKGPITPSTSQDSPLDDKTDGITNGDVKVFNNSEKCCPMSPLDDSQQADNSIVSAEDSTNLEIVKCNTMPRFSDQRQNPRSSFNNNEVCRKQQHNSMATTDVALPSPASDKSIQSLNLYTKLEDTEPQISTKNNISDYHSDNDIPLKDFSMRSRTRHKRRVSLNFAMKEPEKYISKATKSWTFLSKNRLVRLLGESLVPHTPFASDSSVSCSNNICQGSNFGQFDIRSYQKLPPRLLYLDLYVSKRKNSDHSQFAGIRSGRFKKGHSSSSDTYGEQRRLSFEPENDILQPSTDPETISQDPPEIVKLQSQITTLANDVMNYEVQLASLHGQLVAKQNKIDQLKTLQLKLLEELDRSSKTAESIRKTLEAQVAAAAADKAASVEHYKGQVHACHEEIDALKIELDEMRNSPNVLKATLLEELSNLYQKLEERITELGTLTESVNIKIDKSKELQSRLNSSIEDHPKFIELRDNYLTMKGKLESELQYSKMHHWNLRREIIPKEKKLSEQRALLLKYQQLCSRQNKAVLSLQSEMITMKGKTEELQTKYKDQIAQTEVWKENTMKYKVHNEKLANEKKELVETVAALTAKVNQLIANKKLDRLP